MRSGAAAIRVHASEQASLMTSTSRLHPCGAGWIRKPNKSSCHYAAASFFMGLLGLLLFGILSLPAIVSGCLARRRFARKGSNPNGEFLAKTGIFLGFAGLISWGSFAFLFF